MQGVQRTVHGSSYWRRCRGIAVTVVVACHARAHTHRGAAVAGKQAGGGADGKGMDAPACRQSANVGPPAERRQSASAVPLRRRCKQDLSGCACLAWCTALWVCSVTYRRCFATNAPHCGQEIHALPMQMYHSHCITRVVQSTGE